MKQRIKDFEVDDIRKIDSFLNANRGIDIKNVNNAVLERSHGRVFSKSDHIKALIYSLLTNQRKWSAVEPKLPMIDELFFQYDEEKIKEKEGTYFEEGIRKLKCGNISIKAQMASLNYNLGMLDKIEYKYGAVDNFVTSMSPDLIVSKIAKSGSEYKLKNVGEALAWEYLRNVCINGSKPDTHLRRFFGSTRIGISQSEIASVDDVIKIIKKLELIGEYNQFEIDYLIWAYCADGKGEICTSSPRCEACVIRECCNYS